MTDRDASRGEGAGARVGVFLCRCAGNLGRIVRVDDLAAPSRWPGAACVAVHDLLCAAHGLAFLRERIRAERLDRIVVAACSPREHDAAFRAAAGEAGLSPWRLQRVNLREQVEWAGGDPAAATARAERLVRAGLARVALHRDLPLREVEASPDVVVIGGGAAGLSAALSLAGRRRRVAVVERAFALGGLANRLDEVFPDGACASCFMAPAVDAALHHPEVEVLTGAEVTAVRGSLGRFDVEVALRPRFVDPEACLGCPACVEACPVEGADPVERGLGARRAISFPWPGCLPYVPAIDPAACLRLAGGGCTACEEACPAGAIRLGAGPERRTLRAGALVLATGLEPGEPAGPPGVVSTWRLERMLHPDGPTGGRVVGPDGRPPRAVLLAAAAGGEEAELAAAEVAKLAHALRRRLPGVRLVVAGGLDRSPRHGAAFRALAAEGVALRDGAWIEGAADRDGDGLRVRLRDGAGEQVERVDLAVVHAPSRPAEGSLALAGRLRIAARAGGFLDDAGPSPFEPTATVAAGVFVAGAAAGPRPIRAAIRDGAAAAGRILGALQPGERIVLEPLAAVVDEARCCGCGACEAACAFGAVARDPATARARVEPLHCRGCGGCAAACPTGAADAPHQTRAQIAAEITALLAGEDGP